MNKDKICARFWMGLWLITTGFGLYAFVVYDGIKQMPKRACLDGELYIYQNDGVYVKSNKKCIVNYSK